MKKIIVLALMLMVAFTGNLLAQQRTNQNSFRQLVEKLPSPNSYRTATGRPGPNYFQQQVDYNMAISIDENAKVISGEETITYHNNSPQSLSYLWLQLDQNVRQKNSFGSKIESEKFSKMKNLNAIKKMDADFDGGFKITYVQDSNGNDLETVENYTILKVILPEALASGKTTKLKIKWHYTLNNLKEMWGRSGYNEATNGSGDVFAIAQFYPRLCVFNDVGWQIKQNGACNLLP